MIAENPLWTERYRPTKIEECILPENLKKTFQEFVNRGEVPNLLLVGPAGTGKTTVAKAMLNEIDADYMIINGSMNGNIDTLRNDIQNFASSVSFMGGRKYVILDESDYLNPNSTQPALRNFMEEYSKNCGFILTGNFKKKIIEPLQSRTSVIDFVIPKDDLPGLSLKFFKRVKTILEKENVEYDKNAVASLIAKHFPDSRRILNELQRYSATGCIDSGILIDMTRESFKALISGMKEKDFNKVRKWVAEQSNLDAPTLFSTFYDTAYDYVKKDSIPLLIVLLAKYEYQNAFVVNPEINIMAALTEIMVDVDFE